MFFFALGCGEKVPRTGAYVAVGIVIAFLLGLGTGFLFGRGGVTTVTVPTTVTHTVERTVTFTPPIPQQYTSPQPTAPTTTATQAQLLQNITLKVAMSTDIRALDIHFAMGVADFEVLGKVYEALFKISWDGSKLAYVPGLVKSYSQLNETAWLFILRNNVVFHNGKKLTAEDVKYSLLRSIRLSGIGKQLLTDAAGNPIITDIVIANETAFILKLSAPFTPLFENLAHLSTAIMPKEIALKYWDGPITSIEDVIGTGPFRLVSYEKGAKVVLQRFDGYWGNRPNVKTLEYLIMPDASARMSAVISGVVDVAVGISPDMVEALRSQGIEVYRAPGVRLVLAAINCKRVPDVRIRQALNYAVNKEDVVKEFMRGYAEIATSVASPNFPNVVSLKPYTYNVTKARQLLEEAGFVGKKLTLLTSTRSPKDIQLAQVIQQYLKNVGIEVEIVQMEHTAFLKRVFTDHDFDLAIYGPSPSSLYYALTYWRTGASLNGPEYSNPEYDKLLDEIATEPSEVKRVELYRKAQEILWRDAPAIWLYFEDILIAARPGIKGLQVLPFQMLIVDNVYV